MTEKRIFEILLKNCEIKYDYPKLNKESVDIISDKFTEIIYDTLKQKSSASNIKRCNILKIINNICEVNDIHANEDNYKCFLNTFKHVYKKNENSELDSFLNQINKELNEQELGFTEQVIEFHRKKNEKQNARLKILEQIRLHEQEEMQLLYKGPQTQDKIPCFYETKEDFIRSVLGEEITEKKTEIFIETNHFREKQVKLGYAMINLKNSENIQILEQILEKLSKYDLLEEFEINFLFYLYGLQDPKINFDKNLIQNFPVLYETIIIKISTEILKLQNEIEACDYFLELENNFNFSKLRRLSMENVELCSKIKSIIYELYSYSFCNSYLLRFCDLFQ